MTSESTSYISLWYQDLGPDYYASRTNKDRRARSHIRQLEALGFTVTLTQVAA